MTEELRVKKEPDDTTTRLSSCSGRQVKSFTTTVSHLAPTAGLHGPAHAVVPAFTAKGQIFTTL